MFYRGTLQRNYRNTFQLGIMQRKSGNDYCDSIDIAVLTLPDAPLQYYYYCRLPLKILLQYLVLAED